MFTGNKSFNLRKKPLPRQFVVRKSTEPVAVESVKVEEPVSGEPKPTPTAAPKKKEKPIKEGE